MLSQTSKIAIKATIYLSWQSLLDKKSGIEEIASYIQASKHTVSKALQVLVKHDLVNSLKGPKGGFYLNDRQQNQSIKKIVQTIEGEDVFTACGLGLSMCSETHPCPIHDQYKATRDLIEDLFTKNRIIDLSDAIRKGTAFLMD